MFFVFGAFDALVFRTKWKIVLSHRLRKVTDPIQKSKWYTKWMLLLVMQSNGLQRKIYIVEFNLSPCLFHPRNAHKSVYCIFIFIRVFDFRIWRYYCILLSLHPSITTRENSTFNPSTINETKRNGEKWRRKIFDWWYETRVPTIQWTSRNCRINTSNKHNLLGCIYVTQKHFNGPKNFKCTIATHAEIHEVWSSATNECVFRCWLTYNL